MLFSNARIHQSPPPSGQSVLSYKDIFYKADKYGHFHWDFQWEFPMEKKVVLFIKML